MSLASLLLPFFAITGLWLWLLRRRAAAGRPRRVPRAAVTGMAAPRWTGPDAGTP